MMSLADAFERSEAYREHAEHRCRPETCYYCISDMKRALMSDERISPPLDLVDGPNAPAGSSSELPQDQKSS